jgi:hypothetical protein
MSPSLNRLLLLCSFPYTWGESAILRTDVKDVITRFERGTPHKVGFTPH